MKIFIKLLLIVFFLTFSDGLKFSRCRLATTLQKTKLIKKLFLGNCLKSNIASIITRHRDITLGICERRAQRSPNHFLYGTVLGKRGSYYKSLSGIVNNIAQELLCFGLIDSVTTGNRVKTSQISGHCVVTGVCLIEKVSNRDTKAFTVTPSGKKSYGLYQIPSRWCREGKKGGECNITCEALLDDDIRDDTACAVNIFSKEGFKYWNQWTIRCKNDKLITTEIYKCPDLMEHTRRTRIKRGLQSRIRRPLRINGEDRSNHYGYYFLQWME